MHPLDIFLTYIFVIVMVSSSRILGVPRSNRVPWAAILDFHENQFLRHFNIPPQRKIIEHASLG